MNSRMNIFTLALALTFGALGFTTAAQAGIIVTVGKPAPEDASKKTKPGPNLTAGDRTTTGDTGPCPAETMADKSKRDTCSDKIDPLTGLPADWKCVPIGGGMLYCEGPGAGGSAGEGGAGEWDPDAEDYDELGEDGYDTAEEDLQVLGCAGGSASTGLFAFGMVLVALVAMRRRSGLSTIRR